MAILKVPTKILTDSFLLQDYKDDFTAINNELISDTASLADMAKFKVFAEFNLVATQTIPNNSDTQLNLNPIITTPSIGSNGYKIEILEYGTYEVYVQFIIEGGYTTGDVQLKVKLNDTLVKQNGGYGQSNNETKVVKCFVSGVANDLITVSLFQVSGSSKNVYLETSESYVQIRKVG